MRSNNCIVYSTAGNLPNEKQECQQSLSREEQQLRVCRQRLGGGRVVTLVKGFVGTVEDLQQVSKMLKSKCSAGGSVKDGAILIQGNHRELIINILNAEGYNAKMSGG